VGAVALQWLMTLPRWEVINPDNLLFGLASAQDDSDGSADEAVPAAGAVAPASAAAGAGTAAAGAKRACGRVPRSAGGSAEARANLRSVAADRALLHLLGARVKALARVLEALGSALAKAPKGADQGAGGLGAELEAKLAPLEERVLKASRDLLAETERRAAKAAKDAEKRAAEAERQRTKEERDRREAEAKRAPSKTQMAFAMWLGKAPAPAPAAAAAGPAGGISGALGGLGVPEGGFTGATSAFHSAVPPTSVASNVIDVDAADDDIVMIAETRKPQPSAAAKTAAARTGVVPGRLVFTLPDPAGGAALLAAKINRRLAADARARDAVVQEAAAAASLAPAGAPREGPALSEWIQQLARQHAEDCRTALCFRAHARRVARRRLRNAGVQESAALSALRDEEKGLVPQKQQDSGFGANESSTVPPDIAVVLKGLGRGMSKYKLMHFHSYPPPEKPAGAAAAANAPAGAAGAGTAGPAGAEAKDAPENPEANFRPAYFGTWNARRARARLTRERAERAEAAAAEANAQEVVGFGASAPAAAVDAVLAASGGAAESSAGPSDGATDAPYIAVAAVQRTHGSRISARRPFAVDPSLFNYEVDSEAEWLDQREDEEGNVTDLEADSEVDDEEEKELAGLGVDGKGLAYDYGDGWMVEDDEVEYEEGAGDAGANAGGAAEGDDAEGDGTAETEKRAREGDDAAPAAKKPRLEQVVFGGSLMNSVTGQLLHNRTKPCVIGCVSTEQVATTVAAIAAAGGYQKARGIKDPASNMASGLLDLRARAWYVELDAMRLETVDAESLRSMLVPPSLQDLQDALRRGFPDPVGSGGNRAPLGAAEADTGASKQASQHLARKQAAVAALESHMPVLLRLVHGSTLGMEKLKLKFREQIGQVVSDLISQRVLDLKVLTVTTKGKWLPRDAIPSSSNPADASATVIAASVPSSPSAPSAAVAPNDEGGHNIDHSGPAPASPGGRDIKADSAVAEPVCTSPSGQGAEASNKESAANSSAKESIGLQSFIQSVMVAEGINAPESAYQKTRWLVSDAALVEYGMMAMPDANGSASVSADEYAESKHPLLITSDVYKAAEELATFVTTHDLRKIPGFTCMKVPTAAPPNAGKKRRLEPTPIAPINKLLAAVGTAPLSSPAVPSPLQTRIAPILVAPSPLTAAVVTVPDAELSGHPTDASKSDTPQPSAAKKAKTSAAPSGGVAGADIRALFSGAVATSKPAPSS
jgi:hypothetical protein